MSNIKPANPDNVVWLRRAVHGGVTEDMISRAVIAYVAYKASRGQENVDIRDMIKTVLQSALGDTSGDGDSTHQNAPAC